MKAYRCDKCGTFRTDAPTKVEWWVEGSTLVGNGVEIIDLCPDCAPEVLALLEAIAKTADS